MRRIERRSADDVPFDAACPKGDLRPQVGRQLTPRRAVVRTFQSSPSEVATEGEPQDEQAAPGRFCQAPWGDRTVTRRCSTSAAMISAW